MYNNAIKGVMVAYINLNELMEQAHDELKKDKLDDCYPKILYLLDSNPNHFFYLYLLGSYYSKKENLGASIMAYERAITLYPDFSEALNNAAGSYRKLKYHEKAIEYFKRAIEIGKTDKAKKEAGPNYKKFLSDYISNLGSCYVAYHDQETALKYLNEALEVNPDCINALWNKSLILLEQGNYEEGFKLHEFGDRKLKSKNGRNYNAHEHSSPTKFWNGEKNSTVVVYGEQGIGDELMFATILPDLARDSKQVIYDGHPRLYKMLRRSFKDSHPNIHCYGTRKDHVLSWIQNYDIDFKIPIGSLASFYRKKKEDFPRTPYLIPDEKEVELVKQRFDSLPKKKLNIGISWKGGTAQSSKNVRILPMEFYNRFFEELDANFISLQYDDNARMEVDKYCESSSNEIHHWQKEIDDYDLTSALISQLDLIISVPQSIIHLAGVMGVRAYQLTPYKYIWQMGPYGEDMPWYNSVTNFWQKHDGDWESVVEASIEQVKKEFHIC